MSKVHSKLGASKAERWLRCPGSVALCDTVPPAPSSIYADEGSAAHWIAEQCLFSGADARDMIGEVCPDYPKFPCTDEMAAAVQVYLDYCRHLMGDETCSPYVDYLIEHRFALSDIDSMLFGTCDFCALHLFDGWLFGADYKHGAGVPVTVFQNAQAMYYMLGAIQHYLSHGYEINGCTIAIVQPRGPGKPIKTWSPTLRQLSDYAETLRHGVEATRQPDAPLRAGPWCRWCDAKPVCPKYQPTDGRDDFRDIRLTTADFDDVASADLDELLAGAAGE